MEISEKLPLIDVDEFLKEVEEIEELIKTYDENLEEIKKIQNKLMKQSWTPQERENLSAELQRLGKENKECRKLIAEVNQESEIKNKLIIRFIKSILNFQLNLPLSLMQISRCLLKFNTNIVETKAKKA